MQSPDESIQGINGSAIKYPSPWFDLSQCNILPDNIKELFKYCMYFYNTNCIVPAIVNKLAAYPITDLVFAESENEVAQTKWKTLLVDKLNLPFELMQAGIDLGIYGNCIIGIYFPFNRYLVCPECGSSNTIKELKENSTLKGIPEKILFKGICPNCNSQVEFKIRDKYCGDINRIKLIRYNPLDITISYDPVSGNNVYMWDPPGNYMSELKRANDLELIERAPKIVLESARESKSIVLNKDTLFHLKRPTLAGQHSSWGTPLVIHALKDLYYLQTLKRAQEAIAAQHIIPFRVLFPQGGTGVSQLPPAQTIGLNKWKDNVEEQLQKWRRDPNHIPIMNFPVGVAQISGDGRALLLGPEIQNTMQQVVASMGVPQEFVFGGLTWTGSSITLRMLENTFTGIRDGMQRLIKFLTVQLGNHLKYPHIDIYMSDLKMADDIQRQQITMNLEAAGKISETRMLSEFGYDYSEEKRLKAHEFGSRLSSFIRDAILQSKAQGEANLVGMEYQIKSQRKQILAEGEMQVLQGKAQAEAQNKMMQMGIMQQPDPYGGQQPDPYGGQQPDPYGGQQPDPYGGQAAGAEPPDGAEWQQDPNTGLLIEPTTGLLYDPNSGQYYDPSTMQPVEPPAGAETGYTEQPAGTDNPAGAETGYTEQSAGAETGYTEQPAGAETGYTEQPAVDPVTGYPIDYASGMPVDPNSGWLIDIATGTAINPYDGSRISLTTGEHWTAQQWLEMQQQGAHKTAGLNHKKLANIAYTGEGAVKNYNREDKLQYSLSMSNTSPGDKAYITRLANKLRQMDTASRNSMLQALQVQQPTLATLVKQKLAQIQTISASIPQPKTPNQPDFTGEHLSPITRSKQ